MNAKAAQKKRTHETILQSAAQLLRARGISGARVAEVMQGAGLTVGGFYAHFASKEALVDDAFRRTAHEMRERLFGGLDEKAPEDRAEIVLKRYLSPGHRDEVENGCPLPAVVGEVGTTAPEHREVLSEYVDDFAGELAKVLSPVAEMPKRQLALALVALMYGGLSLARALRGTGLSDDVIRACRALGRQAVREVRPKREEP